LKKIGIYGNLTQLEALFDEYISGRSESQTEKEKRILKSIPWIDTVDLKYGKSITYFTRQRQSTLDCPE
jgi:hypothetical protein